MVEHSILDKGDVLKISILEDKATETFQTTEEETERKMDRASVTCELILRS